MFESFVLAAHDTALRADLAIPGRTRGLALLVSARNRRSNRNLALASALWRSDFAVSLLDLYAVTDEAGELVDSGSLARRLDDVLSQLRADERVRHLRVGIMAGDGTTAAALRVAAQHGDDVASVVSWNGAVEVDPSTLARVSAPTLFIAGSAAIARDNRAAASRLPPESRVVVVSGDPDEQPGTVRAASQWLASTLLRPALPIALGVAAV